MTNISLSENANTSNTEFDSESELETNIMFDNIQEESLKEKFSYKKCNSTFI